MTRFLPIIIILLATCYLLPTTNVFAQEITPTTTPSPQINPQAANAWESFKNLFIPDTLKQVNCSGLPLEVCTSIKPISLQTEGSALKTQASGNQTDNKVTVGNAAGQYIIASGIHTPPEVANASTDIFSNLIAFISKAFESLFGRGEKQAKNYAGTVLPEDVTNQNFALGLQDLTGFASGDTNVLGIQNPQTAMDKSLPLIQCSELPAGLCDNNKPNFAK